MSRHDLHHEAFKQALSKDGWLVTHDPFTLQFGLGTNLYADFGAEKLLVAEKQGHKIVVEVKTFGGLSFVTEFQKAIGQYIMYRDLLEEAEPHRQLYLAVTELIYNSLFKKSGTQLILRKQKIKIVVFDEQKQEVVTWID